MELKKLLYRYDEVSHVLGLSVQAIYRLVEEGELERIYVMKREPRITLKSITDYISKKTSLTSSLTNPR